MTKEQIFDGNKIIAEFMKQTPYHNNTPELMDNNGLLYHLSWDWLMPVVIKLLDVLDTLDDSFELTDEQYSEYEDYQSCYGNIYRIDEKSLEELYKETVEIIQWYNELKKNS